MSFGRAAFTSISILVVCFASQLAEAQWRSNPASFLEPNRFAVVSEVGDHFLWLEAGYGGELVTGHNWGIGMESLIWSRLRQMSGFRFPVETADYFFGFYGRYNLMGLLPIRLRVSHISSHLVDGVDSIFGGSSSKFSKEFASLEVQGKIEKWGIPFFTSVGVDCVFHQVTKFESSLQAKIAVNVALLSWGEFDGPRGNLYAFASNTGSAFGSAFSGGVGLRTGMNQKFATDLFARYQSGPSRTGVEAGRKENQFEIGIRLVPFEFID